MTYIFLDNQLNKLCGQSDIIVLKGFPIDVLRHVGRNNKLLDEEIYTEDGRIDLSKINPNVLLMKLLTLTNGNKGVVSYESFVALTSSMRDLRIIGKRFGVVTNNLLNHRFENPTNSEIPDFDSKEFQENTDNEPYMLYYSFCSHMNGKEYVQYVGCDLDSAEMVDFVDIIPPIEMTSNYSDDNLQLTVLSADDDSMDQALEYFYNNMRFLDQEYYIDKLALDDKRLGVMANAAKLARVPITFYIQKNEVRVEVRQDLVNMLKEIWGYDSFRQLKMYHDLNVNHEIVEVSQGEIIETVVRQGEASLNGHVVRNIILTSPTGAGKSLLFQLSAIYLAEKYGLLTIVVSPLVALMDDQVQMLVGNYNKVATINGNVPADEKDAILDEVRAGGKNILYLAPELLLSYSIETFVGNRKIGLLVVDEAHTVTTWGRDFRIDYWFLGDYIRRSKRTLGYSFPIFALTATAVWDPSGKNDMVFDTIRSLNMDPCIKYIGAVRRDNIVFDIEQANFNANYERSRNALTVKRITESVENNTKTIVYFPYKSTIRNIFNNNLLPEHVKNLVTSYYSDLPSAEKRVSAEAFRSGEKPVMCATKAYGMGIDVPDIREVYHHAPTGCLSDYVQEIGRLARNPEVLGVAKIDFSERDFKYTRTLHGLSTIRPGQLRAVLRQLMSLYKINGEKRNMLISANDFIQIFPGDNVDYDQKLKSCLLLISNDLRNKLRFHALIVRPKNLFSKTYICVSQAMTEKFEKEYAPFISTVSNSNGVYKLDADKLWNARYSQLSFPAFKRKLMNLEILNGYNFEIRDKVNITLRKSQSAINADLKRFFDHSEKLLGIMAEEHRRININDVRNCFNEYNEVERETFWESFKIVYASSRGLGANEAYCSIQVGDSVQLVAHGYERVRILYQQEFEATICNQEPPYYCRPSSDRVKICELLSCLGLADYQRQGGEEPMVFVRINNPNYLNDRVRRNDYNNAILEGIYEKYGFSERIFTFFFQTPMSNKTRWDFIEAYFLGVSEEDLYKIGMEK